MLQAAKHDPGARKVRDGPRRGPLAVLLRAGAMDALRRALPSPPHFSSPSTLSQPSSSQRLGYHHCLWRDSCFFSAFCAGVLVEALAPAPELILSSRDEVGW